MAFTPLSTDLNTIQGLATRPNKTDGLTAAQLKAKFDYSVNLLQNYLNGTLLAELAAISDGLSGADNIGATALAGGTATKIQGILEELDALIKALPSKSETLTNKRLDSPKINEDVAVTATATEINILDGIPATLTAIELGYLDGVTSAIQAQINGTVKTTGNQTIAGIKTFSDPVRIGSDSIIEEDVNSFMITGGTAEDTLIFNQGVLKFNLDKVWTEGNDGTGSGLDADKLDGVEGSGYVNTTGTQTVAGVKTFSSSPIVPAPTTDTQASTKKYADDLAALKINKAGDTMSGALAMGTNKITGLGDPSANTDAVNLQTLLSQIAALHNLDVLGSTSISAEAADLDVNKMPTSSGNAKAITAINTLIGSYTPVEKDSVFVTYLMAGVEEKYQFLYEYSGSAWTVATPTFSVTMANGSTAGIVEGASGDAGDIVITNGLMTAKDASIASKALTGYTLPSPVTSVADVTATDTVKDAFGKLQAIAGDRQYTENNYVTDSESHTKNIDNLDKIAKDTADETRGLFKDATVTAPTDYLAHLYTVTGYAQSQTMPNNADGQALYKISGLTAKNEVVGENIANGASVTFNDLLNHKYYISYGSTIITGDGGTYTITNSSGSTTNIWVIDMGVDTSNPLYNKTADEMATMFPNYFDGLRNTVAGMRLFGRGKNLFDKLKANKKYYIGVSGELVADNNYATSDYIKIIPGLSYTKINNYQTAFYDSNKIFISRTGAITSVAPVKSAYARYTIDIGGIETSVFMEGLTATPYEPYTAATAYLPNGTLRSVPAISDAVELGADGVVRNTKNCEQYTLLAADIITLTTSDPDVDYITTKSFTDSYQSSSSSSDWYIPGWNKTTQNNYDFSTAFIGYAVHTTATSFRFVITKGTYANLAAAQAALAGTVITYQLATPIVTELSVIGDLKAYPNGSISAEPCYSGYATGATTTIGTAELPIKAIRKVESISLDANGNAVRTDISSACSVDTTTLTITGYDATKVYFYDLDIDTKYTTTGLKTYQVECPTAVVTHDFGAGSTAWTLTANENKANYFTMTNAGGAANCIAEAKTGKITVWKNTSGQTLTVKTATSTGVTIATTKTATLMYTGTDFIKIAEV